MVNYRIVFKIADGFEADARTTFQVGQGQWTGQGTIGSFVTSLIQIHTLISTSTTMAEWRPDLILYIVVTKETNKIMLCGRGGRTIDSGTRGAKASKV